MLQKILIVFIASCCLFAQDDGAIPLSDVTIRKVVVSPANPEAYPGETIHFKFQAFTAEGKEVPAAFTWTFAGGKLHHDGRFIAGERPGTYTLEAKSPNGVVGSAKITIKEIYKKDNTPRYLKILPEQIHLQPGQKCQFTFAAYNRHGEKVAAPLQISFGGGNLDKKGNFVAGSKHGKYKFIVSTPSGLKAEAKVFIGDVATSEREPVYIKVTPARVSLYPGERTKFQFKAYDKFGEQVDCNLSVALGGGKMSSGGEYIAGEVPGRYEFKVTAENKIQGMARIHVMKKNASSGSQTNSGTNNTNNTQNTPQDNTIDALTISPTYAALNPGEKQQFAIRAYNKYGKEVTPRASIQFSGGKFTPNGTYTAGDRPGTYKIVLETPEGIKAEAKIKILGEDVVSTQPKRPGPLAKIVLTPQRKRIYPMDQIQFSFQALDKNGNRTPTSLSWSFQGGRLTAQGLYTAGYGHGQHYVTLTGDKGIEATSIVAIVPRNDEYVPRVWIELSPRQVKLSPGQSFRAKCRVTNDQGVEVGLNRITWEFLGGSWDQKTMTFTAGNETGDYYLRARYADNEYVVARIHVDIR
ncbi:PKD domain-containing protein [Candidatus Uabimicrobium amorphum]|uniref:PKD domain-containing protein n=1 Tax=Uabimicrobium amorphum TaxID=2596890 RepID=A0A5S9F4Q6_UABAM|nr:PKD domain-containing protein [Candidatus Uabimicrobium amorphum]BBM84849.1 hypothetical protein UABAM_03210 [Candidatus Uabimicrobium amorphum]